MRNPISLLWWLFLLLCLQAASWALDSFHHLVWGRLAIHLLKTGYLVFAGILFFRYLSFRSQKTFEAMVEAYNRIAAKPLGPLDEPRGAFYKYLLYITLIMLSSSNFISLFTWTEPAFRATLLLDAGIWLLALVWITRAHWLKALGLRERMKEYLDNARSRMRSQTPEFMPGNPGVGKRPFLGLAAVAVSITLAISAARWHLGPLVFRVDALKGCLESVYRDASETLYQQGRMDEGVLGRPCLVSRRGEIAATLGLVGAEPKITAVETGASDFFGNGVPGDEGLELGASGRFRKTADP